jgi:hypothetical protein
LNNAKKARRCAPGLLDSGRKEPWRFPLNLLRDALRDAYFFKGTACAGKSTLSRAFAQKQGFS